MKPKYYIVFKRHMISDVNGNFIQFKMASQSESDIGAFRKIDLYLPINSLLYAGKAYNQHKYEDQLVYKKQIYIQSKEPVLLHLNRL